MSVSEMATEPRFTRVADGVWAQVEDRSGGLPRHFSADAHDGRIGACTCRPLLESMDGVLIRPIVLLGTRLQCRDEHDLVTFATGRYRGLDLRIRRCRFCGAVEVRDVSIDLLVDESGDRRLFITDPTMARRRDALLGWYAGRRVAGRIYT